jgi:hypothetical protein
VVVTEDDHANRDAESHADQPRREEAARDICDHEPRAQEREQIGGITRQRHAAVMRELPDRREDDHGDGAGDCELPKLGHQAILA